MEWIRTADQLPTQGRWVLGMFESIGETGERFMMVVHVSDESGDRRWHVPTGWSDHSPTYWMALPKLPKEREKPPLGLIPKRIRNAERRKEILAAVMQTTNIHDAKKLQTRATGTLLSGLAMQAVAVLLLVTL